MATYLVTGGAGFIGSHIVDGLLAQGETVRVLDNLISGKLANLEHCLSKIDFIEGDMLDEKICLEACKGVDVILHEASLGSVPGSVADPLKWDLNNIHGTVTLLKSATQQKVRRFISAGSSSAYGDTPVLPKIESMTPNPLSPYAVTKLTQEYYCQAWSRCYGLETGVLRYFNVFGPRQSSDHQYAAVIPKFVKALMNNESPVIFGDGEQSRDFTFVEDVVQANLKAATASKIEGVYNLAYNSSTTLNQLFVLISEIMGKTNIKAKYEPTRVGDVRASQADNTRICQELGFKPEFNVETGLKKCISWYLRKLRMEN